MARRTRDPVHCSFIACNKDVEVRILSYTILPPYQLGSGESALGIGYVGVFLALAAWLIDNHTDHWIAVPGPVRSEALHHLKARWGKVSCCHDPPTGGVFQCIIRLADFSIHLKWLTIHHQRSCCSRRIADYASANG